MARTHAAYPEESRERTVQLVRSTDKSIPTIADELGISHQTLRNGVHQADVDAGTRDGLTTAEREELRQLGCDNKRLRMGRDILKSAHGGLTAGTETDENRRAVWVTSVPLGSRGC